MLILFKLVIANIFSLFLLIFILLFFIKRYKKIQIILLILILFIFYSPLPNLLVYSVESLNSSSDINDIKQNFDKIVILSGYEDIRKTKKFNHLYLGGTNNRIIEGVRVHIKKKKDIIFSGSSSHDLNSGGAYVAEKFFKAFNIDSNSVIIDDKAINTEDTFLFLKENFNNEKHLIVTSAMHMQRCKLLAIKNGINYILYPVDFRANHENIFEFSLNIANNVDLFQYGLREVSALLFYKISGKI
jgi:uncharacterized SAM-binding protein YcdF (DUF218 family)